MKQKRCKNFAKALYSVLFLSLGGCNASPVTLQTKLTLQDYDPSYDEASYTIRKAPTYATRNDFINALDISMESLIEEKGGHYYEENKIQEDFFSLLTSKGINAVRIRLFHNYASPIGVQGAGKLNPERVCSLAQKAKKAGLAFILDLHYSDSWADPKNQSMPYAWKNLSFNDTLNALSTYTSNTLSYLKNNGAAPDYLQIGNEINNGILWPMGKIDWTNQSTTATSFTSFTTLLNAASAAARATLPSLKIILHTANALENTDGKPEDGLYFFNKMATYGVDYDIMGSSFYAQYTQTKLATIASSITQLTESFHKPFLLMEYSYGFTARSHPYAENSLSAADVKDSGYPLSIQGQSDFMIDVLEQVAQGKNSLGTAYWGGEWIPVEGAGWGDDETKDSWANQALFTYEGLALPSFRVFKEAR